MSPSNSQEQTSVFSQATYAGGTNPVPWGFLTRTDGEWEKQERSSFGGAEEIHLYRLFLRRHADRLGLWEASLDGTERNRADRFRFAEDRERYIAAHGILREILGSYAGVSPAYVVFRFSPFGKPSLDGPGDALEFNMSHARDIALIALSRGRAVGVDIEEVPATGDGTDLADSCLSPSERTALERMPALLKREILYRWWTRKEARAKAEGIGLSLGFPDIQVIPPFLLESADAVSLTARWGVWDISPAPGYVATLVTDGSARSLRCELMEPRSAGYAVPCFAA